MSPQLRRRWWKIKWNKSVWNHTHLFFIRYLLFVICTDESVFQILFDVKTRRISFKANTEQNSALKKRARDSKRARWMNNWIGKRCCCFYLLLLLLLLLIFIHENVCGKKGNTTYKFQKFPESNFRPNKATNMWKKAEIITIFQWLTNMHCFVNWRLNFKEYRNVLSKCISSKWHTLYSITRKEIKYHIHHSDQCIVYI